jgi:lysophospholipase L1-like esterase
MSGKVLANMRSTRWFHRLAVLHRDAAILTFNTLVFLIGLEAASIGLLMLSSLFRVPEVPKYQRMAKSPYYADQDWATDYWREHFQVSTESLGQYSPYVIWRRAPLTGKMINIDQHGIRRTPGADCRVGAYKVFTFGGSTLWGYGAPDWGTIPAYLQADLEAPGRRPICVVNYAELGYVSTQSLIELERQLQAGNVPDLVVFYDGVNDIEAAFSDGPAGVHLYLGIVASLINRAGPQNEVRQIPFVQWLRRSASFTLFSRLASIFTVHQTGSSPVPTNYRAQGVDTIAVSDSVVQVYLTNYRIVEALARTYGFKFLFFWQPIVCVGHKSLTKEEQVLNSDMGPRVELVRAVYQKIERATTRYKNLYYLAQVFDEQTSQIYFDSNHVTPEGNQLVAGQMLDVIKDRLNKE